MSAITVTATPIAHRLHNCAHERNNPEMLNDARWQEAHQILHYRWHPRGRYIWAEREMRFACAAAARLAAARPLASYDILTAVANLVDSL